MNRPIRILCFIAALLIACGSAYATPYTFEMGGESSIDVTKTTQGLSMWTDIYQSVSSQAFLLDVGDSFTFKFARMGTDESWVNEDDLKPMEVTAYLDFDMPDITQDISGESTGFSGKFEFNQGWQVIWDDPVYVGFGDGGRFAIELSDATFSSSMWTGPHGPCWSEGDADIFATVTLEAAPSPTTAPVPEPATAVLLGLGVGLLGVTRLKRKKESEN
ncbi:PEP-CTERM sorting domain-containing protein [Desulfoluna spongiiphila]|uniref:PEP-CTERM sorting domain-containing protein n=1 Tax=Desulfoluna spongiiphila TaxID=419481 RepID=UPI0012577774|nr:PEP-CTERM sorting domain-containing protein [Desulfoluna spongiiphila]VVS91097.1 prokaryotic membrane lipoprotein lipid attachment site profile [Desulfoluna spongiiphila]